MQGHERSGLLIVLLIMLLMDVPGFQKHDNLHQSKTKKKDQEATLEKNQWGYITQALGLERTLTMIKTLSLLVLLES